MARRAPAGEIPFRREMEAAFGEDFSQVRAHLGRRPALDAIGAKAATVGAGDVFFGDARPGPRIVAHELGHVVQARRAPAAGGMTEGHEPSEREADRVAGAVARGERAVVSEAPAAGVQRDKHLKGPISDGELRFDMVDVSSLVRREEDVAIEYVPASRPSGAVYEFIQAVKTVEDQPVRQARANQRLLRDLGAQAAAEPDPEKKKELLRKRDDQRKDWETAFKLGLNAPDSVRLETRAGDTLESIARARYWRRADDRNVDFEEIFSANATVLSPLMPSGVEPRKPLPAGLTLFLPDVLEQEVGLDVFGHIVGDPRASRAEPARSPAYFGQQPLAPWGGDIEMIDRPGAFYPTKFTFETNLMRKDTGTWLGGVRWGFNALLSGIVSEWAELSMHVSDTFTEALDRFAKVFRNPHRAMQGDTLRSLAARFLGNPDRWPEIASLSPALKTLADTDQIPVGTLVEVPGISPDKA